MDLDVPEVYFSNPPKMSHCSTTQSSFKYRDKTLARNLGGCEGYWLKKFWHVSALPAKNLAFWGKAGVPTKAYSCHPWALNDLRILPCVLQLRTWTVAALQSLPTYRCINSRPTWKCRRSPRRWPQRSLVGIPTAGHPFEWSAPSSCAYGVRFHSKMILLRLVHFCFLVFVYFFERHLWSHWEEKNNICQRLPDGLIFFSLGIFFVGPTKVLFRERFQLASRPSCPGFDSLRYQKNFIGKNYRRCWG